MGEPMGEAVGVAEVVPVKLAGLSAALDHLDLPKLIGQTVAPMVLMDGAVGVA